MLLARITLDVSSGDRASSVVEVHTFLPSTANPSAFENARFEVEYLRVYGKDGAAGLLPSSLAACIAALLSALLLSFA